MVDTVYRVVAQKDRRMSVEMVRPDGRHRLIPDFKDKAEADAWIIQTKRLRRAAHPHAPGVRQARREPD